MPALKDDASDERNLEVPDADPSLARLYAAHAPRVRRYLAGFGVPASDLDDVSQEVFLIVTAKREHLSDIARVDLWLREICRKAAAGHRRRGFRKREVSSDAGLNAPDEEAVLHSTLLETEQDVERLYRAIDSLDDEAKDLIAMHELGGLPLVDVAALVEHDRKTVRKRLAQANRRLKQLFRDDSPTRSALAASGSLPFAARGEHIQARPLQLLGGNRDVSLGQIGHVLIAVWPGPPSLSALELLDHQMREAVKRDGPGLVYLAIVEASTSTPTLEARKKISSMLKHHSQNCGVYPHVLLGGFSWIARPIMAGLTFLSGVTLPMPFFGSVERAALWLCAGYLRESGIASQDVVDAVQELRRASELRAAHSSAADLPPPPAGAAGSGF